MDEIEDRADCFSVFISRLFKFSQAQVVSRRT